MHTLGDQWIELIDGQEHMVKAVKKNGKCTGCVHLFQQDRCHVVCKHHSAWTALECPFKVIDLGILRDGCLSSPWDKSIYPVISVVSQTKEGDVDFVCLEILLNGQVLVFGMYNTIQDAKDAWNRRA